MQYRKLLFILSLLVCTACDNNQAPVRELTKAEQIRALEADIEREATIFQDTLMWDDMPRNIYLHRPRYAEPIMLYIGDEDFKAQDSFFLR